MGMVVFTGKGRWAREGRRGLHLPMCLSQEGRVRELMS